MKPAGINNLSGRERIKSRKDFEILYSEGRKIFSSDRKLKGIFSTESKTPGGLKIAAVVSGKTGTAVWRNRIKRLIKDSFRLNKFILLEECKKKNIFIRLIISPYSLNQKNSVLIRRVDIEESLVDLLNQAKKKF